MASPAIAIDRIVLQDGREWQGSIEEENANTITFRIDHGGIRSKITVQRSEIARIERGIAAEEQSPQLSSSTSEAVRDTAEPFIRPTRYMLVPIQGRIGFDASDPNPRCVTAEGLRDAFRRAKRGKVEHVVLRIDSDGGSVREARRLADVISEYNAAFQMHAVIQKSISAAMWATFGADQLYVLPGAAGGAAVAYSRDPSSGDARVDAKFNSAIGAELASWAGANGHSEAVARAMVVPEAELWATEDNGNWRLDAEKISDDSHQIDDDNSVVTLIAAEMERYGLAQTIASVEDLGELLGIDRWEQWSRYGERSMYRFSERLAKAERRQAREAAELERRLMRFVTGLDDTLASAISAAEAAEPESPWRYEDYHVQGHRVFTARGRQRWQRDHDNAIRAWQRVAGLIHNAAELRAEAESFMNEPPHSDYWSRPPLCGPPAMTG